jgi:hypothetical protein
LTYQPPKSIWEVSQQLRFDEPLEAGDPRFVETRAARGDFDMAELYRQLGIDPRNFEMKQEPRDVYSLFCGHRGCGKSTELRRIAKQLDQPDKFCVIFLDAVRWLDTNNLQYADVLLALAYRLLKRADREGLILEPVLLTCLEDWFKERIEKHEATRELAADIRAGAEVSSGVPFLGRIFATLTNSLRINSTYKEEVRSVLKNSFSDFAKAFNQLIAETEAKLKQYNKGRKLLFIVDGTDRLSGADSRRFFVEDSHQLKLIRGNFMYCAPIHLIYEGNQIGQIFPFIFKLPMIKLTEKGSPDRIETAYQVMRDMIFRRADPSLFQPVEIVDQLIQYSGGHPRDLLRLLSYAFGAAEGDQFDQVAVTRAIKHLATDYRRILETGDYQLLRAVDQADVDDPENSERLRCLLFNLALLEYNAYWWQSHPVIRTLPGYQEGG